MKRVHLHIIFLLSFVFFNTKLSAFNNNDSTKTVKPPRHYFNKTIYLDYYVTGKTNLDTTGPVSMKLKSYQVSQSVIGYNFPIVTKDIYNKDSTRISNFHFLIASSYSKLNLNFGGISKHELTKFSVGCRGIYNNGKKSIFFAELSPFVTKDNGFRYTGTYRLACTFLYNYSANEYFSFRAGYTRSFLWGNRFQFPYIGIRVGKLDKINFSVQFPRGMTFNVPIGQHVRASIYTKPQGGLYTVANTDSLLAGNNYKDNKFYFGRYEFLSGLRIDVLPSKFFNFYFSTGLTTNNNISFYPTPKAKKQGNYNNDSYSKNVKSNIFVNFGFVFRFGKTKSIYYNMQMYNALDINNTVSPGDNNINKGNGDIPLPATKVKINNPDEVLDLIETQDLY